MQSFQRGNRLFSIASYRSRPWLSRSLPTSASASASVRFLIPCWQTQWNLTQWRSFRALMKLKVWLPKPCMCRNEAGSPLSLMVMVTWCSASGSEVQKSQLFFALRRPVRGSRLTAWLRSGNFIGSRRKKTGVLFPTRSQFPCSV